LGQKKFNKPSVAGVWLEKAPSCDGSFGHSSGHSSVCMLAAAFLWRTACAVDQLAVSAQ
jgi:hypothetical protein